MDKSKRIELVSSVVTSLSDSISRYEAAEAEGNVVSPGYNIGIEDSRSSIIRRCRVAREELMNIIRSLEG